MYSFLFLISAAIATANPDIPRVRRVEIVGNLRVSAAGILRQISTAPEKPFDPNLAQADLRKIYSMGVFQNVTVESAAAGDGLVDVTYRVKEFPRVSAFQIEGVEGALGEQILDFLGKEKLKVQTWAPFNPSVANKAALAARDYLRARKFPNADVQVVPEKSGSGIRVCLEIHAGQRMEVGAVRFSGNESFSDSDLRKQLKVTRPAPFWARWSGVGRYVPEDLASDLDQVRRFYQSHGFAAVAVGTPEVDARILQQRSRLPLPGLSRERQKLAVGISVVEGPRFTLDSVREDGDAKAAADDVARVLNGIRTPMIYDVSLLETSRRKIMDALGHHGYAMARVDLEQSMDAGRRTVSAVFRIDAASPVLIGRINFEGNNRVPDRFLRRSLRIGEGDLYDSSKIDQGIERLNKSGLIKELHRSDVALHTDEERNVVDITFKVKEKDRQGIYSTGGTGGIGGGYLGLIYTAFNLFRLGETLSLELDGGAAQSNILLDIVGTHFLGTPFTLALSGFNRLTDFNVANIVPGPENLVSLLSRRTKGAGLSGAYSITSKLQAGIGFRVERDSITTDGQTGPAVPGAPVNRSDLTPFLFYDSARGEGAATRGYRIGFSHSVSGSTFLRSLDSTGESLQFSRYIDDPLTHGRNALAFRLQGSVVRPQGSSPLFIDRRLFPGDESVRGFQTGGLSPWVYVPDNSSTPLQPAGADTFLGFSAEYRVPVRGALSGVGFVDLGWTSLSSPEAAQVSKGALLVQETNGLLRASVGGELRLQLPMIRQPARLIFAWNPLRLSDIFRNSPSLPHLSDPKGAVHFALGNIF